MRALDARLYLLFTPELCIADPWATLERALLGGIELVQWRTKAQDPADLARCMHICSERGVPVVVNDDVALAAQLGAAGAHVGQQDMPPPKARKLLGADRWLGISTHDLDQLQKAHAAGANYVGFGPCFPTETKGYAHGLDRDLIRAGAEASEVPLFAIGGIHRRNLPLLVELGVRRIAVSAAVLTAERPQDAAERLLRQLPDPD